MSRVLATLLLGIATFTPLPAAADDLPLLVVIEAEGTSAQPAVLRDALSRALSVRVVTLLDAEAPRAFGTLIVRVTGPFDASFYYRDRAGDEQWARGTAPRDASFAAWVATSGAAIVSDVRTRVADWSLPSEVLDPFRGRAQMTARLIPVSDPLLRLPREVIDPWSVPWSQRPGVNPPNIIDPSERERGGTLTPPRR
jgi:hypothetical protein